MCSPCTNNSRPAITRKPKEKGWWSKETWRHDQMSAKYMYVKFQCPYIVGEDHESRQRKWAGVHEAELSCLYGNTNPIRKTRNISWINTRNFVTRNTYMQKPHALLAKPLYFPNMKYFKWLHVIVLRSKNFEFQITVIMQSLMKITLISALFNDF
jgi:hypothetical protein